MKVLAKMFVIYGVLVLLVVEAFNFVMKVTMFFLSMLFSFAGLMERPTSSEAAVPQTILSAIVYAAVPIVIMLIVYIALKAVGVAAPAGGAGGATGFVSKTGGLAGKLGMSGIRGAGVKKGALKSGIRALGNLSGDDLRRAGLASNVLGAKGMGRNLFRAGMAKDGFDAVRGTKAGQNKGKVNKANAEGSELDKDGKPIDASKKDKGVEGKKDATKAVDKKDDVKAADKKGDVRDTTAGMMAGVGIGDKSDSGRVSESSELTKDQERTENERVAEAVRESNNLDKTASGEKVPGASVRDSELNVNRTSSEIKNATLNGSSNAIEPTSRTNSVDKNVDIGSNKDGIPVDAEVADATARKSSDALKGITEAAPGQPASEDGSDTAQMRSALVARNEEGQAISSFAEDEIRRSGETLATATAMHGTVVPRDVTDSGDFSTENIEARTADAHRRYMEGVGETGLTAAEMAQNEDIMSSIGGGVSTGHVTPAPEAVPVSGSPVHQPEAQVFSGEAPVSGSPVHQAEAQVFSGEAPVSGPPVYQPEAQVFSGEAPRHVDSEWTDVPRSAPVEQGGVVETPSTAASPVSAPRDTVSDPMIQASPEVTEQVMRHEHHHFVESASGLIGTGSMGMMDRGDALATLLGGTLGALAGRASGGGDVPHQTEVTISPDTMRALDRAVETRSNSDRAAAKGAFMQEIGKAAPDVSPEILSEMEDRFEEAIAAAERRAIEEAEERERQRRASEGVNRGKRKRR